MSKGRYVAAQSLAEKIYWQRTYSRVLSQTDWYPNRPTDAQQKAAVDAAWARAEAVAARYLRMKKRAKQHRTRAAFEAAQAELKQLIEEM